MATRPTDRSVISLRQLMLDDMAMRAMGLRTQHDYVRHVRAFAAFLRRSPDTATAKASGSRSWTSPPRKPGCCARSPPLQDSPRFALIRWANDGTVRISTG